MNKKRQNTIIDAVNYLRSAYNVPNEQLKSYKKSMKKDEAQDSYLFSEDTPISDRAYRTFMAWYRHTQTTYDEDISSISDKNTQISIKKLYNTRIRNTMLHWREKGL